MSAFAAFVALALAAADPLAGLARFPCADRCDEVLALHREHERWMRTCHACGGVLSRAGWCAWEEAMHVCYWPWEELRAARWCAGQPEPHLRAAGRRHLRRLRTLLGEGAYAKGWMPPPFPPWAWRLLD